MAKKESLKRRYEKEEKRHDRVAEKETAKHEKKHKVELDEALKIGSKKKKRK